MCPISCVLTLLVAWGIGPTKAFYAVPAEIEAGFIPLVYNRTGLMSSGRLTDPLIYEDAASVYYDESVLYARPNTFPNSTPLRVIPGGDGSSLYVRCFNRVEENETFPTYPQGMMIDPVDISEGLMVSMRFRLLPLTVASNFDSVDQALFSIDAPSGSNPRALKNLMSFHHFNIRYSRMKKQLIVDLTGALSYADDAQYWPPLIFGGGPGSDSASIELGFFYTLTTTLSYAKRTVTATLQHENPAGQVVRTESQSYTHPVSIEPLPSTAQATLGTMLYNFDFTLRGSMDLSAFVFIAGEPNSTVADVLHETTRAFRWAAPPYPVNEVSESSSTTSDNDSAAETRRKRLEGGLIGGLVGFALFAGVCAFFILRSRRRRCSQSSSDSSGSQVSKLHGSLLSLSSAQSFSFSPADLPLKDLNDSNVLAQGYFGRVYAVNNGPDRRRVCLKVFNTSNNPTRQTADYLKEVSILSSIKHPNIVNFIGSCSDDTAAYLMMEFCEGLALSDHICPNACILVPESLAQTLDNAVMDNVKADVLKHMTDVLTARGSFERFTAIRFAGYVPETSPRGHRMALEVERGTRVINAEESASPASLTRLCTPLLILNVGPRVLSYPLAEQAILDADAISAELHRIGSLPETPCLSWVDRLRICVETARALNWLHTKTKSKPSIVHADVKPQNILLTKEKGVRLGDVGLSFLLSKDMPSTMSFVSRPTKFGATGGTMGYKDFMLDDHEGSKRRYGVKNDVFSFGVVLLDCFPEELTPPEFSQPLRELVLRCVGNWESRPSSDELLKTLEELYECAKATADSSPHELTDVHVDKAADAKSAFVSTETISVSQYSDGLFVPSS